MKQFSNRSYDLEERTAKFGQAVIVFCKSVRQDQDVVIKPLVSQLVRAATSIGANYMEANGASSKSDFRNKIYICKKETQESKHWLRMLAEAVPVKKPELRKLWSECQQLTMIFQKITSSLNRKEVRV